ncbi:hypothetical protein FB567DRAFT_132703 [Paraphoma chrysanthemicola]|uniref:Uncharacterized protein n=1 Tax=Paraphoma chrysanthemicola TaxID=798071 RepID=A0A8K0QZ83_9PLEO|nr:hypothetical protein FB567DRAFT_132703 [Paraphoma chrysanthemicola]
MPHSPANNSSERENTGCDNRSSRSNITPTPRNHHAQHSTSTSNTPSSSQSHPAQIVYIVTDTCYTTPSDFTYNKGTFRIDSVHSNKRNANARAKKIMYDTGQCKVDVDKIIEEMKRGLFTGIGIGGKSEDGAGCYARKCQVERKMVDEDSEDEDGMGDDEDGAGRSEEEDGFMSGGGDRDGDVHMD